MVVNALCNAFSGTDEERRAALDLAREVRQSMGADGGWWQTHQEAVPSTFDYFIDLEETATRIFSWETALVPGLLQTREYRRALLWAEFPTMPTREVELTLDIVQRRQETLKKQDFHFEALIAESALHTLIGSPVIVADQLSYLLTASGQTNITVRVVGRQARDPLGLIAGSFVKFDLPHLPTSRMRQSPVVYSEGYFGKVYLERDAEIAMHSEVVERLRRVAHSETESRNLVLAALKEWNR